MIKPQGISAQIPHNIPEASRDAIRHLEREYLAYLPAYQKGISFGKLKHYVLEKSDNEAKPGKLFDISYTDFYGKYIVTSGIIDGTITEKSLSYNGWKYNTYCTIGVSTFLYYHMGYNDTDNILKISYGDKNYQKHPISIIAQNSANKVAQKLAAGKVDGYGIRFILTSKDSAAQFAHNGYLVISAWENKNGVGHVSTIIGGKRESNGYDYSEPMTYNIGSRNGYMPLTDAYYGLKNKDIRFYIVE